MPRLFRSAVACLVLVILRNAPARAGWAIAGDGADADLADVPASLTREIEAVRNGKQSIKSIALTPADGWVVLAGKNGFAAHNAPEPAFQKLGQLAKQGAELKSIALGPAGTWVILYDKSSFAAGKVPNDCSAKLEELSKSGAELQCVALTADGGWVVLHDRTHFASAGIPAEAEGKLREFEKKNAELTAIAFTPQGGWGIVGPGTLFCRNVPDEAFKKLQDLGRQKTPVRSLAFSGELLHLTRDDADTRKRILARLEHYKVPAMSVALIDDNKIVSAHGYGVIEAGGAAVNELTRFQAASVSKPVASLGALRLVDRGTLSLDEDLDRYLVSWKIKPNQFTAKQPVTLREVLSHTAGFNVHGFGGYQFGHKIPTLVEVLNGVAPANSPAIVVESVPGVKFAYSGGGITVMQQAVVDVTHQPFDKAMQDLVLGPLEMKQSTYEQPLPANWRTLAAVGHEGGKPLAGKWHVYPEMAAAGLWTTPSDLGRFVIALAKAGRGDSGAILPPALAKQMLSKQPGGWGLGIEVDGAGPNPHFSHNGVNAGFLSQLIGYVQRGQGVVVMVNSGGEGGSALIDEICQDAAIELGWD